MESDSLSPNVNVNDILKNFSIDSIDEAAINEAQQKMLDFNRLMSYYKCAIMEIETKFKVLSEEYSLQYDRNPISGIHIRLKSLPSMREKLNRKGLPLSLSAIEENLNDVAGIRVICSFPEDVNTLTDAFLAQDDITLIQKKDYITHPKPNGYRSMHLIVSVPIFLAEEKRSMTAEVQIRTIAMDCWASLEHQLLYKKDRHFTNEMAADLNECAQLSAELDARMDSLRKSTRFTN